MPNAKGTVTNVYRKPNPKPGVDPVWSFVLDTGPQRYNCAFSKPVRPDGHVLMPGDKARFQWEQDQYGRQVLFNTLETKAITRPSGGDEDVPPPPPPKPRNNGGGGNRSYGGSKNYQAPGRDDYWKKKEELDKERDTYDKVVRQPMIMRQSANSSAVSIVTTAISKDILPLPSKKGEVLDAIMLMYDEIRNTIFSDLMKDYERLSAGKRIFDNGEEDDNAEITNAAKDDDWDDDVEDGGATTPTEEEDW